jgi:UDP-N-acetylmuramyl pentapeptide synthase
MLLRPFFKTILRLHLKLWTKIVLARHKPEIIAIAGSTNKTTVQQAITGALKDKFKIRSNPKYYNTEIGLPLAVLNLFSGYSSYFQWLKIIFQTFFVSLFSHDFPDKLVLQLGVDRRGDMDYLLSIIKPKIAVITEICPIYKESFISENSAFSLDLLAGEYAKLIQALPPDGLCLLNNDDERVRGLAKFSKAKILFYGQKQGSDYQVFDIKQIEDGQKFKIKYSSAIKPQMQEQQFFLKRFGLHHIYAFLISLAVKNHY